MGKLLRDDPTAVTAELSAWLSNQDSPALWAPFAFSIRGFAYEVMDECELARSDYNEGLNLYDTLAEELGEETIQRMFNNVKFMRVRLEALPPAPVVSPVESYFEMPSSEVKENIPVPTPTYQTMEAPNDETGIYENVGGEDQVGEEGGWETGFDEKVEDRVEEHVEEYVDEQGEEQVEQTGEQVEEQAEDYANEQADEQEEVGEQVQEQVEEQVWGQVEERAEDYADEQAEEQAEMGEHVEEQLKEQVEEQTSREYADEQAEKIEEQTEEQLAEEQAERREEEQAGEQVEETVTANQHQTHENWEDDVSNGEENENGPREKNLVGDSDGIEMQTTQAENQEDGGTNSVANEGIMEQETEEVLQGGTFESELEVLNSGTKDGEEVPGEFENVDVNQESGPSENLD